MGATYTPERTGLYYSQILWPQSLINPFQLGLLLEGFDKKASNDICK